MIRGYYQESIDIIQRLEVEVAARTRERAEDDFARVWDRVNEDLAYVG